MAAQPQVPAWVARGPMLPTAGSPPTSPGFAAEIKWDGMRALVVAGPDGIRVISRSGRDVTTSFPELRALTEVIGTRRVVLDGEIVALGTSGQPDFVRLQDRIHRPLPTTAVLRDVPVCLYLFDLLHLDGADLLATPYLDRRDRLTTLGLERGPIRVPDYYTDVSPAQMLEIARQHHLEGIVAKRLNSRYIPGKRSPDWIKTAIRTTTDVVIGGWVPGSGRYRHLVGSLLVGLYDQTGTLRYAGHVGTGFSDRDRKVLAEGLDELSRPASPFADAVPQEFARYARWIEPVVTAEISYRERTADGRLRHPSFRHIVAPEQ
ncbi:non-homologous end-joining DNA ligase [Saccharopolyspora phatthalungensis]|uniref:DNA ligase (ATP) n=1 Tax=Saccharopolyspora phatthalungensis TaxID=664693 RepID=A0A840QJI7_9PSEU|nr:non-homologous end-joining DNA ligase [Saccharopolyspora phatthalungensis]MBB5159388.1 bifunctional non-homologous end joining protein LigD [Saccharopolyspora phatthalungensis]